MEGEDGDAVEPLLDHAIGQGLVAAAAKGVGQELHVGMEFRGAAVGQRIGRGRAGG